MNPSKAEAAQKQESLIESRLAYQGHTISLHLDTYQMKNRTKVFEKIHHPGAVVIIPIDDQGKILMIKQWRRAIQKIMLELPAGTLDHQEKPLLCAQRELQEETGFRAQTLTPLDGFYTTPGFCDEYLSLFLGENLILAPLPQDEDEAIDLYPIELDRALNYIQEGKILDVKSIAGILRYALWKKRI